MTHLWSTIELREAEPQLNMNDHPKESLEKIKNELGDSQPETTPQQPVEPEIPQQPAPDAPEETKQDDVEELTTLHERSIAALSYISFLAIVPFYLKKDSKFCRFHGKQGLLLAIIFFFAQLFMVLDLLMDVALILQFVIFVVMGFAALAGKWKKLPWVYKTACKLEETFSLKTKEQEENESKLKPEQVASDQNSDKL